MVKEDKNNKINPDQSLKDKIKKIKVMYPEIITEQNN